MLQRSHQILKSGIAAATGFAAFGARVRVALAADVGALAVFIARTC
jgi:hypothetical protein